MKRKAECAVRSTVRMYGSSFSCKRRIFANDSQETGRECLCIGRTTPTVSVYTRRVASPQPYAYRQTHALRRRRLRQAEQRKVLLPRTPQGPLPAGTRPFGVAGSAALLLLRRRVHRRGAPRLRRAVLPALQTALPVEGVRGGRTAQPPSAAQLRRNEEKWQPHGESNPD